MDSPELVTSDFVKQEFECSNEMIEESEVPQNFNTNPIKSEMDCDEETLHQEVEISQDSNVTQSDITYENDTSQQSTIIPQFQCEICRYQARDEGDLEQHSKKHIVRLLDDEELNSLKNPDNHRRRKIVHRCAVCNFKTSVFADLKVHIRTHVRNDVFHCVRCEYKADNEDRFLVHIRDHRKGFKFFCTMCDFKSKSNSNFGSHVKCHTGGIFYPCNLCSFRTHRKELLTKHRKIHFNEAMFSCAECNYTTKTKEEFADHVKAHDLDPILTPNRGPLRCRKCIYITDNKNDLQTHFQTHNNNTPAASKKNHIENRTQNQEKKHLCDKCCFSTNEKDELDSHTKTCSGNDEEAMLRCSFCSYRTHREEGMSRHMKLHTKKYYCDICDFTTDREDEMKFHLVDSHTKVGEFCCDKCNYKTARKNAFDAHVKTHERSTMQCKICDYVANKLSGLKYHMMQVHEEYNGNQCPDCPFYTTHRWNLMQHLLAHLRKKANDGDGSVADQAEVASEPEKAPSLNYQCDKCEYMTDRRVWFNKHVQSHGLRKVFCCTLCNLRTQKRGNLDMHIRAHMNDTIYDCKWCDYHTIFEEYYEKHKKVCSKEKLFCCKSCNYRTFKEIRLLKHVKIHDASIVKVNAEGKKLFCCDMCSFATESDSHMQDHLQHHWADSIYKCKKCDFKTVVKERLNGHGKTCGIKKTFKCDKCDFVTEQEGDLNKHKETHSSMYYCDLCQFKCTRKNVFHLHMELHQNDDVLCCNTCHYRTKRPNDFERHKKTHLEKNCYVCKTCNFETEDFEYFGEHQAKCEKTKKEPTKDDVHEVINEDTFFRCSFCGYATKQKDLHDTHIELHVKDENFVCDLCNFDAKVFDKLEKHIEDVHLSKRLFCCNNCDFRANQKVHLERHNEKCNKRTRLRCKVCDYTTYTTNRLEKHINLHNCTKGFRCNICEYTTRRLDHLHAHIRFHNSNDVMRCDICCYLTDKVGHMAQHKHKHSQQTIYSCPLCEYKTHRTENYTNHTFTCKTKNVHKEPEKSKQSKKPIEFNCTLCEFATVEKLVLTTHIERHRTNEHVCNICCFIAVSRQDLNKHLEEHKGEVVQKCRNCNYQTNRDDRFRNHRKACAKRNRKLGCNWCDFETHHQEQLDAHVNENHSQIYNCIHCEYNTRDESSFGKHMNVHKNGDHFACPYCPYTGPRWRLYVKHFLLHSNQEKGFKCNLCGYMCVNQPTLSRHNNHYHSGKSVENGEKMNVDSEVEKVVKTKNRDETRLGGVHTSKKRQIPFVSDNNQAEEQTTVKKRCIACKLCEFKTDSVSDLKKHMNKHAQLKVSLRKIGSKDESAVYPCDICDYSAETKEEFVEHCKTHNKQNKSSGVKKYFCCDICDFITERKELLRTHRQTHAKSNAYSCSDCDYVTNVLDELNRHVKVHQTKKFQCNDCDYETNEVANFNQHIKFHQLAAKVSCEQCEYRTSRVVDRFDTYVEVYRNTALNNQEKVVLCCNKCHYLTQNPNELNVHRAKHLEHYACDLCNFKTNDRSNFLKHTDLHTELSSCTACSIKTDNPDNLVEHFKHRPEDPCFWCDLCDFVTNSSDHLRAHESEHREHLHLCETCGLYVDVLDDQACHAKLHADITTDSIFCDVCTFRTDTLSKFTDHVLMHRKTADLSHCNECDYTPDFQVDLVAHLTFSSDKPVFLCDACDFKSNSESHLFGYHLNTHRENSLCFECGRVDNSANHVCDAETSESLPTEVVECEKVNGVLDEQTDSPMCESDIIETNEGDKPDTTESDTVETIEGDNLKCSEGYTLETSEDDKLENTESDNVETIEGDELTFSECDTLDTTEGAKLEIDNVETMETTDGDALKFSEGGTLEMSDGDKLEITESDRIEITESGILLLDTTEDDKLNVTEGDKLGTIVDSVLDVLENHMEIEPFDGSIENMNVTNGC